MEKKTKSLIDEGYDILECLYCDKLCKPVKKLNNDTIVYEKHDCSHGEYSMKIDKNGDIIEES